MPWWPKNIFLTNWKQSESCLFTSTHTLRQVPRLTREVSSKWVGETDYHTLCYHVNEQAEATLLPANNIMMKTVRTAFDGDPLIMNNSILVWISAFRWKSSDTCSRDLLRIPMTPMMMIRTAFDGDPRDSREPVIPNHFSFSTPPQTTASPPPTWKCNLVGSKIMPASS